MTQVNLYYHGGSKNHGCEAIIRSTNKILNVPLNLYSTSPKEDIFYGIDEVMNVKEDKIFEIFDYVIRDIVVEFTCKGLKKGSITREMVGQWISGTDEKEKIERACEKENAYKNLLESFHDLDEEDKLEEIIKGVFELRDFLEIVNKKYDENNEMLDVLEVTDTDEFSDKLDVIYSYVTSIKEEVAKLFEIANSYSKSFDI